MPNTLPQPNFISMSMCVHTGLKCVDLPNRSLDLPRVYVYVGKHPLRPDKDAQGPARGTTYIVLVDVSKEGKIRDLKMAENLKVPLGRESQMRESHGGCAFEYPCLTTDRRQGWCACNRETGCSRGIKMVTVMRTRIYCKFL